MNLRTVLFGACLLMQPFRLLSAQPATDGESFVIRGAWHNDDWYTDAYGQNPAPFYRNPFLNPPARPPYPWQPNGQAFDSNDALYPDLYSFQLAPSYTSNADGTSALSLQVTGKPPANVLSATTWPPQVPLQATTANTGGFILPGTYLIAICSIDADLRYSAPSHFVAAVVPAGTSANTITISDITFDSGAVKYAVFAGPSALNMHLAQAIDLVSGSSVTLTALNPAGYGMPDLNFQKFLVRAKLIRHGGVWGAAATAVGTDTITVAGAGWTTNQWAGHVVSLYGSIAGGQQFPKNMTVASNTTDTLTLSQDPTGAVLVGDAIVMRAKSASITANTIGDSLFVNSLSPSGLTADAERGNLIYVIAGTGAGQPPVTIESNTTTVLTINGKWTVTPDATSIWIITEPTWTYESGTAIKVSDQPGYALVGIVATIPADNYNGKSIFVQVITSDANGLISPPTYAPFRELYIFGKSGSNNGEYPVPAVNLSTTLAAAITSTSATTATLTSVAGFPAGPFLFTVGTECIYCPSGASTSLTGLIRGYDDTTAATHLISAAVSVTTFTPDLAQGAMQLIALTSHSTLLAPINAPGPITFYADLHQDATGGWALLPSTGYVSVDGKKFAEVALNRYTVQLAIRPSGDVNVTGSSGPYPI